MSAAPKFKIGDRVVVHRLDSSANIKLHEYLETTVTITDIEKFGQYPFYVNDLDTITFGADEIELEQVFNSPLYQELK